MTTAKGLTNGAIPMGAVFSQRKIYDAFMQGPENAIELFHGYTYSAHPVACAAALATSDIYAQEGLLTRAAALSARVGERRAFAARTAACHRHPQLRADRRGGAGAAAGQARARAPSMYSSSASSAASWCVRPAIPSRMSPPLIIESKQIARIVETLGAAIREVE